MEVAIPKLRSGSYFPDWLLERRRRAERALTTVIATCYLLGVSTRRMEKLVETLQPLGQVGAVSLKSPLSGRSVGGHGSRRAHSAASQARISSSCWPRFGGGVASRTSLWE